MRMSILGDGIATISILNRVCAYAVADLGFVKGGFQM